MVVEEGRELVGEAHGVGEEGVLSRACRLPLKALLQVAAVSLRAP